MSVCEGEEKESQLDRIFESLCVGIVPVWYPFIGRNLVFIQVRPIFNPRRNKLFLLYCCEFRFVPARMGGIFHSSHEPGTLNPLVPVDFGIFRPFRTVSANSGRNLNFRRNNVSLPVCFFNFVFSFTCFSRSCHVRDHYFSFLFSIYYLFFAHLFLYSLSYVAMFYFLYLFSLSLKN